MTKKVLAIFLAIFMALSFSACGGEIDNGESSTAEVTTTAASETTSEMTTTTASETTAEMKTIEPPADGWTPELLNQVMYLNGKPFSLPCTLEDLGEGYSLSEDMVVCADATGACQLLYNKEIVATVIFTNCTDNNRISDDSKIVYISFERSMISDFKNGFDIKKCSINGVFLDSTKEEVTQKMGVPTVHTDDDFYHYYYKDPRKARVDFMFGLESQDSLDTILISNN
ncbi:MAG TPA: hypothetical protein PKI60_01685 [Oscillospiraceae bacterium]|nr:hypothetical protein [Oscillospiraceae bacterium]